MYWAWEGLTHEPQERLPLVGKFITTCVSLKDENSLFPLTSALTLFRSLHSTPQPCGRAPGGTDREGGAAGLSWRGASPAPAHEPPRRGQKGTTEPAGAAAAPGDVQA